MIRKILIENFKCFQSEPFELRDLTVLAGINGAGKSTFIQSFYLSRFVIDSGKSNFYQSSRALLSIGENQSPEYFSKLIEYVIKEAGIEVPDESISNILSKEISDGTINQAVNFKISLDNLGNSRELINANVESKIISFTFETEDGKIIKIEFDTTLSDLSILNNNLIGDLSTPTFSLGASAFYYLNAERQGPRNIQAFVEQNFINTGNHGEFTGHVLYQIDKQNLKLPKADPRVFEANDHDELYILRIQIQKWMDFIIPGTEINIEPIEELKVVRVSLKSKGVNLFLHPNNTGFGITYVLPIVVSGLIASPGSLLIVENPEAHLHPFSQSRIGQFLSKIFQAGVQVITETHSEHVINGIRIGVLKDKIDRDKVLINFFARDPETNSPKIEQIRIGDDGELTEWPSGFFDQAEEDFLQILQLKAQAENRRKKSES